MLVVPKAEMHEKKKKSTRRETRKKPDPNTYVYLGSIYFTEIENFLLKVI